MTILNLMKLYLITVPIFFAIDMVWITSMNSRFYAKYLGDLLTQKINWPAAIIFYLIYIVAILVFAVLPSLKSESLQTAILLGMFFGFVAYATYDLTNLATLRNWPLNVTLVDMAWGSVLTGSVAGLAYLVARALRLG